MITALAYLKCPHDGHTREHRMECSFLFLDSLGALRSFNLVHTGRDDCLMEQTIEIEIFPPAGDAWNLPYGHGLVSRLCQYVFHRLCRKNISVKCRSITWNPTSDAMQRSLLARSNRPRYEYLTMTGGCAVITPPPHPDAPS